MAFPDLLHREPLSAPEKRALSDALTFGFARGVEVERLLSLACPALSDSTFEREAFAGDLFISDLIAGCFPLKVSGKRLEGKPEYFRSVLLSPPQRAEDLQFRQDVLLELRQEPDRRAAVEKAFFDLLAFRDALCGSEHVAGRTVGVRRRIDVLVALKTACTSLLAATGSSRSGLERVAGWVEVIQKQENFQVLESLLDFENGRSVLDSRIQVGYDGTLRRFEITQIAIAEQESFPRGPVSRFFRSLLSFIKGYRFSEEDIMASLLDSVFHDLQDEVVSLLGLSLQLEFYLRGLCFFDLCKAQGLSTCMAEVLSPWEQHEGCRIEGLFNPWLMADEKTRVVTCDVEMASSHRTVIVTGPNSGGKTRLLQSIAITQLMAQTGLFVPARRARLVAVEQLFLSLLEHAEPHQSEGRLGSELLRIRRVFETAGPRSLVLMDELCSGTNPSEGERIFEMVIELLEELGPQVWITTHFLDFAERLENPDRPVLNFLQVELDVAKMPTYQFVPGVAKTSLARNTAARLGVTREELVELIHRHRLRESPP